MDIDNSYSWEKIDSSIHAVVLKLEHYGSLGITRSLGKLGINICGVDDKKISPASLSKYCKNNFVWNFDKKNEFDSIEFLTQLSLKIGKPSILIPTTDETALFISKNSDKLKNNFLFPVMPFELTQKLCSKKEMYYLALKYGMPIPHSFFPNSIDDVLSFSEVTSYPVFLKGIDGGKLEEKTGKKMILVNNKSQLIEFFKKSNSHEENNLMFQEYIPNTKNHMWIFNGYFDSSSACLAAFTGRKLRQNPIYTGMTSLGICKWNEELINLSNKFLNEIGFQGPVDIDFVFDKRDGKYKILDVNPRIGASFRLFVGANGIDTARAMYLDMTGQSVFLSKPLEERKWIVEDKDLLSSYFYFKDKKLKLKDWISSFKGIKEAGYFDLNDMMPSIFVWGNHLKRSSQKTIIRIISKLIPSLNIKDKFNFSKSFKNDFSNYDVDSKQILQVKRYYDQNKYWHKEIYNLSTEPHALGVRRRKQYIMQMLDKINIYNHDRVVDIGCGPGAYLMELLNRGCTVYGIDLSSEMLKTCKSNFANRNKIISLLCADASMLPLSNQSFNIVFCVGLLQYVTSLEKTIEEINRITISNGLIIVCVENMFAISNLGYVTLNKLKNIMGNIFETENKNKKSNKEILSNWFLKKVSIPHNYRLYNPKSLDKVLNQKGFNKISAMTYGYPFKILRRIKLIPEKFIIGLENRIEFLFNKIKLPIISSAGEFYIGIYKKTSESFEQKIEN